MTEEKIDVYKDLMNLMKDLGLTESKNRYDRDTFKQEDGKFFFNETEIWLGDIKENKGLAEVCHPAKTSSLKTPSIVLGSPDVPSWEKSFPPSHYLRSS